MAIEWRLRAGSAGDLDLVEPLWVAGRQIKVRMIVHQMSPNGFGPQIQKTIGPNWSWVWRACCLWPNTAKAHWKNTRHTCATARGEASDPCAPSGVMRRSRRSRRDRRRSTDHHSTPSRPTARQLSTTPRRHRGPVSPSRSSRRCEVPTAAHSNEDLRRPPGHHAKVRGRSSTAVMLSAHCSMFGMAPGVTGSDAPVPGWSK